MGLQPFFGTDPSFDRLFLVPEEKAFSFQQSGPPELKALIPFIGVKVWIRN